MKLSKIKEFWNKQSKIGKFIIGYFIVGLGVCILFFVYAVANGYNPPRFNRGDFMTLFMLPIFFGGLFCIFIGPFILTIYECIALLRVCSGERPGKRIRQVDIITVLFGAFCNALMLAFFNVYMSSDWNEVLVNNQMHTPIYTKAQLTITVIWIVGFIGYLMVSFIPLYKMPPLVLVLGMSAMYLGTVQSVVLGVQVNDSIYALSWGFDIYLVLLPVNCVMITIRLIRYKIREWNEIAEKSYKIDQIPILGWCNKILKKAEIWPIAAFILMWPLLGIIIGILMLFGQAPDSIIKAWTETSDWNLSQRVAPQNIEYDEHYLCTVAAGGHEKVVKPLRLGVRHGHEVIVNRQLCIANAFEQILEEKTPGFHKVVRGFYDKYGFPVARLVRSKFAADVIYILMKPFEWIFLSVLYLVDVNPENRIAIQYTGKRLKDFDR